VAIRRLEGLYPAIRADRLCLSEEEVLSQGETVFRVVYAHKVSGSSLLTQIGLESPDSYTLL
jgi:hypothetical protein